MAIVACGECGHGVSAQAATCPGCGAPLAGSPGPQPARSRVTRRVIIVLLTLGVIGAALWLTPISHRWLSDLVSRSSREHSLVSGRLPPPAKQAGPAPPVSARADAAPPPVYVTTAEQLYRDYNANALALRNRIGNGAVRITGSVTEIDEDLAGRPLVRLSTGIAGSTDMLLKDDQKEAAAQLTKGESVGIQCDRIGRDPLQHSGTPRGDGCVLMLINAGSAEPTVYLAVSSAKEKAAPLYVVGPMPASTCLSRGDMISSEMGANFSRDAVLSKRCAATARESIPTGCHLSSSMPALPDMPEAHLWRYDCGAPDAVVRKAVERKPVRRKSAPRSAESAEERDETPPPAAMPAAMPFALELPSERPAASAAPIPIDTAMEQIPAIAASEATVAPPASSFEAVSMSEATSPHGSPDGSNVASPAPTTVPDTPPPSATPPSAAPASAPTPSAPPPSASPALPEDLSVVEASDPAAADHIASYCDTATASARDHANVAAGCRRDEVAAWRRLVVNNEFPSLDDDMRRKCSEAPFPDSYVAKESCAKYQLRSK